MAKLRSQSGRERGGKAERVSSQTREKVEPFCQMLLGSSFSLPDLRDGLDDAERALARVTGLRASDLSDLEALGIKEKR